VKSRNGHFPTIKDIVKISVGNTIEFTGKVYVGQPVRQSSPAVDRQRREQVRRCRAPDGKSYREDGRRESVRRNASTVDRTWYEQTVDDKYRESECREDGAVKSTGKR
jgi:hypothetical protein